MPETTAEMPLGVIVERREINHAWQRYSWRPVSVVPGAGAEAAWVPIRKTENTVQYMAGPVQVTLHRRETEAYLVNLADQPPRVYVVLSEAEDQTQLTADGDAVEWDVFLATVSPYEAQDYLDSGEDVIEAVPMPEAMIAWVQAFIDAHHVETPFKKRKRKPHVSGEGEFGKPSPLSLRRARHSSQNLTPCRRSRESDDVG